VRMSPFDPQRTILPWRESWFLPRIETSIERQGPTMRRRGDEVHSGQGRRQKTTGTKAGKVRESVVSTESGIPADVKEKMFDPFFTTKPAGEGTGLGLSITHDIIVKQHDGSIEVDTKPGEFAEIRLILPRTGALLPKRQ